MKQNEDEQTAGTTEADAKKEKEMKVAWAKKVEAAIEARETAPHDQEVDANTAAAKEESVTGRCSAQPQGSENRIQNKTDTTTETTEAIESDNMTETRDDRPGNRMLTDDNVIDLCDFSSTTISEDRVQRRACQDHFSGAFNANDGDAVRPKRDMDAEKPDDKEIESDAVRPKCDEDAAKSAVDEDTNGSAASKQKNNANDKAAAAAKNISEENDEVASEDETIRRLVEER